jgi:hypothetical protein
MNGPDLITETALRHLVDMRALSAVVVIGVPQGFTLKVESGAGVGRVLQTVRGDVRRFASLDTAGAFLKAIGLTEFLVQTTDFKPGRLRRARPDRAEALKNTRTKPKQQELV